MCEIIDQNFAKFVIYTGKNLENFVGNSYLTLNFVCHHSIPRLKKTRVLNEWKDNIKSFLLATFPSFWFKISEKKMVQIVRLDYGGLNSGVVTSGKILPGGQKKF